ncbi:hypothetical protein [Butyrivibrio sp. VCB2006]|uniref:hypothetical protein n=1 Tax=Butyrivibrio sp. VCB2006 TaxID=1280679 RepID=UPI000411C000|nr:hypothetical protein [Butyrivibrio sp. VCB2006]
MVNKKNMAIYAAANAAGVSEQEMRDTIITTQDGFFEISFSTEWMIYDIFVDEVTMHVLGIDYRPVPVNDLLAQLPESRQNAS